MSNEIFNEFDDFQPAEAPTYVNEAISKVYEKELSEIEQFKVDLDDQLLMADSPKDQLTEMIIGYIQGVGDVNQVNICSYRAKNGVGIDAWGFNGDEDMSTIDLFLTLYVDRPYRRFRLASWIVVLTGCRDSMTNRFR